MSVEANAVHGHARQSAAAVTVKSYTRALIPHGVDISNARQCASFVRHHLGRVAQDETVAVWMGNERNVIAIQPYHLDPVTADGLEALGQAIASAGQIRSAHSVILVKGRDSDYDKPAEHDERELEVVHAYLADADLKLMDYIVLNTHGVFSFAGFYNTHRQRRN